MINKIINKYHLNRGKQGSELKIKDKRMQFLFNVQTLRESHKIWKNLPLSWRDVTKGGFYSEDTDTFVISFSFHFEFWNFMILKGSNHAT